ncbi:MAG: hypothetical protein LBQ70_04280 [Prevotellaceae bacterium]|jgi:hypothetical protein|nr:hypothetical protein [Prevotellaceae bacterium]
MKKVKFLGLITALLFSAQALFSQSRIVIDQASNAVSFTKDNKTWGLEVNGKEVFSPKYKTVGFQNGLFKIGKTDGTWNVCDKDGAMKLDWIPASDVKITESFVLFEKANGGVEALIYNRADWTVTKATPITYDDMYKEVKAKNAGKGTSFNPTTTQQKIAVEQAEAASAKVPFGAFSFRTNSEGKQELIVDDEVLFTANSFYLFLEPAVEINLMTENYSEKKLEATVKRNVEFYEKNGRWLFRVSNKGGYGLYVLDIDLKDGKKVVAGKLSIPCKYYGVWHNVHSGYAKCDLGGFQGEEYRNFNGVLMDTKTRKPKE